MDGYASESAAITDRAAHAVMLLSLDVTRPFLGAMGLSVRGELDWTNALRDYVHAYRTAFAARAPDAVSRGVADLADFVERRLGATAARVLTWWLRDVYAADPAEHADYRLWEAVFDYAGRRPSVWAGLDLAPERADEVLGRFQASSSMRDFNSRWDEVTAAALSDWDLHMYAVNEWNDDLDVPTGPESRLYLIVRDYRNLSFWDALARERSPEQRDGLQHSAQHVIETTPYLESIGVLPPLSVLRVEWP